MICKLCNIDKSDKHHDTMHKIMVAVMSEPASPLGDYVIVPFPTNQNTGEERQRVAL